MFLGGKKSWKEETWLSTEGRQSGGEKRKETTRNTTLLKIEKLVFWPTGSRSQGLKPLESLVAGEGNEPLPK